MYVNIDGDVHVHINEESRQLSKEMRNSTALSNVKKKVKSRDGKCKCCGAESVPLEVHHIFPVSEYPELACDMGNMISLCQKCHRNYHEKYNKTNPFTFTEFIKEEL